MVSQWPQGQVVFADTSDEPIGVILSDRINDTTARILMFAVLPKYRNCGIGQSLMNYYRSVMLMNGIRTIWLEVRADNAGAIRFYKRNGFSETEILKSYYQNGGTGIRMVGQVQTNN